MQKQKCLIENLFEIFKCKNNFDERIIVVVSKTIYKLAFRD